MKISENRTFLYVALAVSAMTGIGVNSASAQAPLDARVAALIAASKLHSKAAIGVSVLDVQSGETLCAIGADRLLTPASNVKLFTTAAALLTLGEDYQFTTSIYSYGETADGVLNGHLVVVAGGDPAISGREHGGQVTAIFDAWAAETAKTIKVVKGSLVIDDTLFDRQYLHPNWPMDQTVRWYTAPVSAFSLNDNCVDVSVKGADQTDQAAKVLLDPPTEYFEIRNTCTTAAKAAKVFISRVPDSETLVVSGKIAPKTTSAVANVAVVNPTVFAATVLRERLAAAGVKIEGPILLATESLNTTKMKRIAATSHSLASAVRTANKRSQNFYAEMILKTLGTRVEKPSSFAAGVRAEAAMLDKLGIKDGTYTLDDGSGLSRRNAVSAQQFTTLLRQMALSKCKDTFIGSLAVPGEEGGSLRKRMTAPAYAGKVFGKTGHIKGVSALSGYVKSGPSERLLAFSILINGEGLSGVGNELQDAICQMLVDLKP